jgi:hypothetical protein
MRHLVLVTAFSAAALALPTLAAAACDGTQIISCPVEGSAKQLDVCAGATGFTYSFGPAGAPELTLSAPYADGPVTPWPGAGSAIWSSVRFEAGGYAYDVYLSVDRNTEDAPTQGGVRVLSIPGETTVADIACTAGPWFADVFAISDAMYTAGYCHDREEQVWRLEGECP